MNRPLSPIRLVLALAARNLWSRKLTSAVIGVILGASALILVLGLALMRSIDVATEDNVRLTLAGDLQVYSDSAREALDLFGGPQGLPDVGILRNYRVIEDSLLSNPNVEAVIPQGSKLATLYLDNPSDRAITELRGAVDDGRSDLVEAWSERTRQCARRLQKDLESGVDLWMVTGEEPNDVKANLMRATSDDFWASFVTDPAAGVDFLERRIAALDGDPERIDFFCMGTDISLYSRWFKRFRLVKGSLIPSGHRGCLLHEQFRETDLKNPVAKRLDSLYDDVVRNRIPTPGEAFAGRVRRLAAMHRDLLRDLDAEKQGELEMKLRTILPDVEGGLSELLQSLLAVNRENLAERYEQFYSIVAPLVQMYKVDIGDMITLRSSSRDGGKGIVTIKVFGTFEFDGLEGFKLAPIHNIVDLETFRALDARVSSETRREMQSMRAEMDPRKLSRDDIEAALFGRHEVDASAKDESTHRRDTVAESHPDAVPRSPAPEPHAIASQEGIAVGHVAVLLKDKKRLQQTMEEIHSMSKNLGLGLRVVDWRDASGLAAHYNNLVRIVVFAGIGIIFVVALVLINTVILMATLQRTREFGTLRAIGAMPGVIALVVLAEITILSFLGGGMGLVSGAGVIGYFGRHGLPALSPVLATLFGGPRLFPSNSLEIVVVALGATWLAGMVAALYPTLLAVAQQPVVALRHED